MPPGIFGHAPILILLAPTSRAFFAGLLFSILFTYVLLQILSLLLDFFIPLTMIVVHTFIKEILHMRHELHHYRRAHKLATGTHPE